VKILNHDMGLGDFIPPILASFLRKMKSHLDNTSIDNSDLPVKLFVSPLLGSYSQFNEDLIIDLVFASKDNGYYLDIGANDPSFNSNTKRFYDKGWSGINIEPGKELFNKLCLNRSRDINLNIGVGHSNGMLTFYQVIGDPTLSSFEKEIAYRMAAKFELPVSEIQIEVMRLVDVFEHYLSDKQVDFMSVDTEGFDLDVLQSNDWKRFRPTLIMVEIDNQYNKIFEYMNFCKYTLIFNNEHNGIFIDKMTPNSYLKNMKYIDG